MEREWTEKLLAFVEASPTAWHAAASAARRLEGAGFRELLEHAPWPLRPGGRYFVRRSGSALIAFVLPEGELWGFQMMAAHGDSPCFKVKDGKGGVLGGTYTRLSVEPYGGMISASWLDRPLSLAGRAAVRTGQGIESRLVDIRRDLLLIPSVAIHMDRSVNEGKRYDPHVDLLPLLGSGSCQEDLAALVAEAAGAAPEDVLSTELLLYPRCPGRIWGARDEFVSAPRLDDLQCVFACLEGFLQAGKGTKGRVFCLFDNEEVGSGTKQGANSSFLADTLVRIGLALGQSEGEGRQALAQSFLVSADNAHAVHPNHPEYADAVDRPEMNKGVVIKANASQKYTTDAISAAVFSEICRRAGVPVQRYTNRADLPGGSTLGNISSSHVSVDTVDIGLAQLAMHSAYETAGVRDTAWLTQAAAAFYETDLRRGDGGWLLGGAP
ncbi:MAG: M18 family aminopeptidase [Oscillospiraceae bacterium]|nr:M18 family aminopeptidase [Oscillospiraceae bacterium]